MRSRIASCLVLLASSAAAHDETVRISIATSGTQADKQSLNSACSADGAIVAFSSDATNLVTGDANGLRDVFVHDRRSGTTDRVSVDASGAEANGYSDAPTLSSDGRFVVFASYASNLVAGDTNGVADIFVHDRSTGINERISLDSSGAEGNDDSGSGSISDDGQIVAFNSWATNLVPGDTNVQLDVFVRDRSTGITERVSVSTAGAQGNHFSRLGGFTSDGHLVAFDSVATNLVAGDTNGWSDVFLRDRTLGVTERVSVNSSGVEGNGYSWRPAISADGGVVAFESLATNLVAVDTNSENDIFVRDLSLGLTERVSVDSAGKEGNGPSFDPALSADGNMVAIQSSATNLVAGDGNDRDDVFVRDRLNGITVRASVDSQGQEASQDCDAPAISADGRSVSFASASSNLVAGDTNGQTDVFVREHCEIDAGWTNYGSGFPGRGGVIPTMTPSADPELGSSITIDITNSSGTYTVGFILLGITRNTIPTNLGGTILLDPLLWIAFPLNPFSNLLSAEIPDGAWACGLVVDLQTLELDSGAAKGVSFTDGLELTLGG